MRAVAFILANAPSCERIWKSAESAGHDILVIETDYKEQQSVIEEARRFSPDFMFLIAGVPEQHPGRLLTLDTMRILNSIAPLIHLCADAANPDWHPAIARWMDVFRLQVAMDGGDVPGCMSTLQLMDEREFVPLPWNERDIRFGMSGSTSSGRRAEFTVAMQQRGLQLFKGSGPYADAARIMCRFKIMFNHGMTTDAIDHCMCRITEAGYAGCALFENAESPTYKFLTPDYEYFPYKTIDDLDRLLQLPDDIIEASAQALHSRVMRDYSPGPMWKNILKEAKVT